MGEKFVENAVFKDFGQKWKVRNGTVVFQKIFAKEEWGLKGRKNGQQNLVSLRVRQAAVSVLNDSTRKTPSCTQLTH